VSTVTGRSGRVRGSPVREAVATTRLFATYRCAGDTAGGMTELRCPACDSNYSDRWQCECSHPLTFTTHPRPDDGPPAAGALDRDRGLWAFEAFLPVERRVTLGEGWTPLVAAEDWRATFKLEYVSPTGSFKDRGAATTVSRALGCGVDRVLEDSSGNAGAAIATYAARADIPATVYVPADVKAGKVRAIDRAGADIERIDGTRAAVAEACIAAVERGDGWYASHAWNPAFLAGTATFAYEVAAQRGWSVPDAVVLPLGHGTLFLGAYRGFRALSEAGWTDRVPRLLGAQAAGYAPIAERYHGDTAGDNEIADGVHIREPVRADDIHGAIEETDGDAIAVDRTATERALDALHEAGFYVEPTCALALAALGEYREHGVLSPDADVVVPLTGSGLTT